MSLNRHVVPPLALPLLAVCACFPASKSLGEGETDGMASTSTSGDSASESGQSTTGSGTSASSTTGQASGTASESDSESSDTATSTAGETASASGATDSASGTDTASDTDGPEVCELEPIVVETTLQTKTPPEEVIDCGYLTLADPLEDWQAGQDCAVAADAAGVTYRLLWDMQGIDSFPSRAIVGLQGAFFGRAEYFEDKGGLAGGRTVYQRECGAFLIPPDCLPEVGLICLACDSTDDPELVCSAPE